MEPTDELPSSDANTDLIFDEMFGSWVNTNEEASYDEVMKMIEEHDWTSGGLVGMGGYLIRTSESITDAF